MIAPLLTRQNTIIAVAAITAWKAFLAATLQLHPDEAYYWLWSRHLAAGYYDHAPLVAWLIRLTTLVSQAELWVRFSGIAGALIISLLAWRLAKEISGREDVASASVLSLNLMPLTVSSFIITPDIPAFLFWSAAVYAFWKLVTTAQAGWWYLVGLFFGLGLLSKYTAVLLAPSVLLYLLLTDDRRWLKTVHPYAAFLLGCALFLPVVWWNYQHEWISFLFQFGHGLGGQTYSLFKLLDYIGGQMLVAGPLFWPLGLAAGVAFLTIRDKQKLFLALMSLPVLAFFGYASLKKTAGANWPASAYFTLVILCSMYVLDGSKRKRYLWGAAVAVNTLFSLLATTHARWHVLPLAAVSEELAVTDATNWFYGWKELAAVIANNPATRFARAPSPQICAEITYYTGERVLGYPAVPATYHNQFDYWPFPAALRDRDGAYAYVHKKGDDPRTPEGLRSITAEEHLVIQRAGRTIRTYRIFRGNGYQAVDQQP